MLHDQWRRTRQKFRPGTHTEHTARSASPARDRLGGMTARERAAAQLGAEAFAGAGGGPRVWYLLTRWTVPQGARARRVSHGKRGYGSTGRYRRAAIHVILHISATHPRRRSRLSSRLRRQRPREPRESACRLILGEPCNVEDSEQGRRGPHGATSDKRHPGWQATGRRVPHRESTRRPAHLWTNRAAAPGVCVGHLRYGRTISARPRSRRHRAPPGPRFPTMRKPT